MLLINMVRKNEHMFDKVNITPLGLQILIFLARNPDKQFYIREIAKIMNKSGKNIYYQINQMNPSVKNFKIFMIINELKTLVDTLKEISEKIILFGSCSIGEDTYESDIDLLVLTNEKEKVNKKIINTKLNRKIQAVVVNTVDLMKIKEKDKGFYQEINKGITLWDVKNERL